MPFKVCVSSADGCVSVLTRPLDLWTSAPDRIPAQNHCSGLGRAEVPVRTFVCRPNEAYQHTPLGVRHVSGTPGRNFIKNHRKKV